MSELRSCTQGRVRELCRRGAGAAPRLQGSQAGVRQLLGENCQEQDQQDDLPPHLLPGKPERMYFITFKCLQSTKVDLVKLYAGAVIHP